MVALGFAMAAVGLWSLIARLRGRLYDADWLHRVALVMAPAGLVAVIAGWITTEVGRQPYVVYGALRTADAVSPVGASAVGTSLVAFVVIYFAVFGAGILYLLRLMNRPPEPAQRGVRTEPGPIRTAGVTPAPQRRVRRRRHTRRSEARMLTIPFDLTIAWALLLAFAVYVYVILDGFDLGIGILYPLFPTKRDRDLLMNSVAPVWDGNETWLVLGGGGLFAAFPLAYAIIMPAVYPPIIAMLLALVFRGVAFEFRWRTDRWFSRWFWDAAFFGGSFAALSRRASSSARCCRGSRSTGRAYGGGWLDWLSPFSLLCGAGVACGYALLGACWLILKTDGRGARHGAPPRAALRPRHGRLHRRRQPRHAVPRTRLLLALVHLARILWLSPVPIAVAALMLALGRTLLASGRDWLPFVLALALFGLCFAGLGVSMWPWVIPTEMTIWQAAAPTKSQLFMFVGAVVLVPIILAYTGYAYWVFRGKLDPDQGYH